MKRGRFVTIEGCEGVGKSTQLRLLKEYCERKGIDAVFTREPGGTPIAEKIRAVILNPQNEGLDAVTELMLYAAGRRQHTVELIEPALQAGRTVFCDRYCDSTLSYQGYARGLDKRMIDAFNRAAVGETRIDLTLFLNVAPTDGFKRKGGACDDRMEREDAAFHARVYRGFLEIARNDPQRVVTVDAQGTKFETHEAIVKILADRGILT